MSNNDDEYISSSEHESSRNTTDSPTVWIALKFVSTGNLASAHRLTFCRQSGMLFAANLKGLTADGISPLDNTDTKTISVFRFRLY